MFSTSTGELSGTPQTADIGTDSGIIITVDDGDLTASLPSFDITVSAAATVDIPPSIQGNPPAAVKVGDTYDFTPEAWDPESATLSFAIDNQPSWATFSTATGQLTGTPVANEKGVYGNITITVTANSLQRALGPFSILVWEEGDPGTPIESFESTRRYR
jgi:hypothetical protein